MLFRSRDADLEMARKILLNAKMRRTGICGATETVLIDKACAATHLAPLIQALLDSGCAVRGDAATQAVDARVTPATAEDWTPPMRSGAKERRVRLAQAG